MPSANSAENAHFRRFFLMRLRLGLVAAVTAAFACALAPVAQACTPANRAALLNFEVSSLHCEIPLKAKNVEQCAIAVIVSGKI